MYACRSAVCVCFDSVPTAASVLHLPFDGGRDTRALNLARNMATGHEQIDTTFLVVGGGIAGVTCAETLAICCPNEQILLLTESSVVKTVSNLEPVARYLHKFDVLERGVTEINACIVTIVDQLAYINSKQRWVRTSQTKRQINYRYLCLCTGGKPRMFTESDPQKRIITIRDTDSVLELQRRLAHARSVLLVGNGGIASELAYELRHVDVHWVIKDKHISATFVDAGAAHFFLESQAAGKEEAQQATGAIKRMRYGEMESFADDESNTSSGSQVKHGAALGPDWHRTYVLAGQQADDGKHATPIVYYDAHIEEHDVVDNEQLVVSIGQTRPDGKHQLTRINCDFIVSATGVEPRHEYECDVNFALAADGGIAVDELMATNLPHIYAAGDVCSAAWEPAPYWFQMRLWTQARQMGAMAGRSMAAALNGETIYQDFCFELFGHVTQLFGYSVVLLGRYNGQGLGRDYELLLRTTKAKEYIKFVLKDGRLRGAILIGNTELAETCENLILNGIDLTPYGDDILNPDIDIEDYFD